MHWIFLCQFKLAKNGDGCEHNDNDSDSRQDDCEHDYNDGGHDVVPMPMTTMMME